MADKKKKRPASIGGQALMEGIMMRGPQGLAMSLRLPDGTIETSMKHQKSLRDRFKPFGWPLMRGVVGFAESMALGYKCLLESAEKTAADTQNDTEKMSKLDKWLESHLGPKMMSVIGFISAVIGMAFAFFLFFWMPSFTFDLLNRFTGTDLSWLRTLFEGVIRIVIFVSYMFIVSQMKDIKRLFMYHGAEHKAIFCYEAGLELTVDNVRKQKRFHPRCSTSFLFVMIILSILLSSVLAISFPVLTQIRALWMVVKLSLIPVIMGIGFEFIRYAGCRDNAFIRFLSAPGLWMQRITTKEPPDDVIEVGIAALKAVVELPLSAQSEELSTPQTEEQTGLVGNDIEKDEAVSNDD